MLYGHSFDLAAFRRVPFLIAFGTRDTNADDVPRAWDPYLGRTRVERATAYARALRAAGVDATLRVDPDSAHAISVRMRNNALAFLQGLGQT
jgi:hypothetical protein